MNPACLQKSPRSKGPIIHFVESHKWSVYPGKGDSPVECELEQARRGNNPLDGLFSLAPKSMHRLQLTSHICILTPCWKEVYGVVEMFYTLNRVKQLYTSVKTHLNDHFKCVHFIVCALFLNKVDLKIKPVRIILLSYLNL